MKIFDRFKKQNKEEVAPVVVTPPTETKQTKPKVPKKTAKELATEKGEPYVAILSVELDPTNIGSGAFELDWNDKFIANLVRAGYQVKANEPENEIVDRWFRTVCQNVVLETFEQEVADPEKRNAALRKDLGNGRSEFS